jgi:hypothetical protein
VDWGVWMKIYRNKPRLIEMDVRQGPDEANILAIFWSYTHHMYLNVKQRYGIVVTSAFVKLCHAWLNYMLKCVIDAALRL